jgi:hypothetical protein
MVTKTDVANGEAAGGTQLRGMCHSDSHFCFGRCRLPILVASFVLAIHIVLNVWRFVNFVSRVRAVNCKTDRAKVTCNVNNCYKL